MSLKNDNTLDAIIDRAIYPVLSLNVTDRHIFLTHLKQIRDNLISLMMAENVVLRKMLAGSLDREEYDFNYPYNINFFFVITLPHKNLIQVIRDKTRPGYMRLNLESSLNQMKKETRNIDIYLKLKEMVSPSGFLIRNKFQNWLDDGLTKVFNSNLSVKDKFNEPVIHLKLGNKLYALKYRQSASIGHTIFINVDGKNYSIQFSPAFLLENSDFITSHSKLFCEKNGKPSWFAIPKPSLGSQRGRKMVFSVFFPNIEIRLLNLNEKSNLRKVFCLLIKLGDKKKVHKFKGYFVRNIFLWEYANHPEIFWNQPVADLLIYMVRQMVKYVDERKLPFFWDETINMLSGLTECDCIILHSNLKTILKSLEKLNSEELFDDHKLMRYFLAHNDIKKFKQNQQMTKLIDADLAFNINALTL